VVCRGVRCVVWGGSGHRRSNRVSRRGVAGKNHAAHAE
jgi:hypothetical protein